MSPDALEGILLIRKPSGLTSHDVVQVVRRKFNVRRVGHAGTLDPMAEGLLIVLIGRATKQQQAYQAHEKTYEALLRLGTQTDTADATGTVTRTAPIPIFERQRLVEVLRSCEGDLAHRPPAYSAIKVHGRPAYWWARQHQPVLLPERLVRVLELVLVQCDPETVCFRVRCSAGTYIRTLADAIAERLGTAGHLQALIRLSVGCWTIEQAKPLQWIMDADPTMLAEQLLPVGHAAPQCSSHTSPSPVTISYECRSGRAS